MPGGDDEIPQEQPSLEPAEFLVSEAESESPSALMGTVDGASMPGEGELPPEGGAPAEGGTDPSLSVDELLEAAVLGDGLTPDAIPETPAPRVPTFQLRLRGVTEDQKAALKKLFEALSIPEKAWTASTPVVSQLTEFQAVQLLQSARALGVTADCTVVHPGPLPSEEDLALGELGDLGLEPVPAVVEAAPSVVLPKGEKEVLLCSPLTLPQANVVETFGIVIAHRSIARRLFREEELQEKLERELKSVPGRQGQPLASSHLQKLLRDLFLDLRKNALAKGANTVLGVKLEAFPESSTTDPQLEQLRLVAFGTAAVVEKLSTLGEKPMP